VKMVFRLDYEVRERGQPVCVETRYGLTSLSADQVRPKTLMEWVRGHWEVENSLHFIKDRWWDEDRHWTSRPGLAERLASLRDAALNVLRLPGVFAEDLPIRGRADHLGRFPEKALKLIGALE